MFSKNAIRAEQTKPKLQDDEFPVISLFQSMVRSAPTTPPKRRIQIPKQRSNRVSVIINRNNNIIGKSINKPSEPRIPKYAVPKP